MASSYQEASSIQNEAVIQIGESYEAYLDLFKKDSQAIDFQGGEILPLTGDPIEINEQKYLINPEGIPLDEDGNPLAPEGWEILKSAISMTDQDEVTQEAQTAQPPSNIDDSEPSTGDDSSELIPIETDGGTSKLYRSEDRIFYIKNNDTTTKLIDTQDYLKNLFSSSSDDHLYYEPISSKEVYAAEATANGYLLAIKEVSNFNITNDDMVMRPWEIIKISPDGVIDWESRDWFGSTLLWDSAFNQDLDADGITSPAQLDAVSSNQGFTHLKKNPTTDDYYIEVDSANNTYIKLRDEHGLSLGFDWSKTEIETGSTQTEESSLVAVEEQADGTFLIAVKNTFISAGQKNYVDVNWQYYEANADGLIDRSKNPIHESLPIGAVEILFNQDLNDDDQAGPVNITTIETDTSEAGTAKLKAGSDGEFYIDHDGSGSQLLLIKDDFGGIPPIADAMETMSRDPYAIEQVGDSYILAIRTEEHVDIHEPFEKDYYSWEFITVSSNGVIDWQTLTQVYGEVGGWEHSLKQDLNNDGTTGVATTAIETDEGTARLLKSDANELFVDSNGNGAELLRLGSEFGGIDHLFHEWTEYDENGNIKSLERIAPYAIEQLEDGSFKLAIKEEWSGRGIVEQATGNLWQFFDVDASGLISTEPIRTERAVGWEILFNQDLNQDKTIGPGELPAISTDQGSTILRQGEDELYIDNDKSGNNLLLISDPYDLLHMDLLGNASSETHNNTTTEYIRQAYAIEKTSDDSYKLAIQDKTKIIEQDDKGGDSISEEVKWEFLSISPSGQVHWEDIGNDFDNEKTLTQWEEIFNQDFNNDGTTGLGELTEIESFGAASLKKSADNSFFIEVHGNDELITIKDSNGLINQDLTWSYDDPWHRSMRYPVAVEAIGDEFWLGIININEMMDHGKGGHTDKNWEIIRLNDQGIQIDQEWTQFISEKEIIFQQDLNDDAKIGISFEHDYARPVTDIVGAKLLRDTDYGLYIETTDKEIIPIIDQHNNKPRFDYGGESSSGNDSSSSVAVEEQADGSYKLAINQDNQWNVYSISSSGILDYNSSQWGSISKWEVDFNQDLNGDSKIGIDIADPSNFSAAREGQSGTQLFKDAEKSLYIKIENDDESVSWMPILDDRGNTRVFDYSQDYSEPRGNSYSHESKAYAIEQLENGSYKLAIRYIDINNGIETKNWSLFNISETGILDSHSGNWSSSILPFESIFKEDLNGDGSIGLDEAKLTLVATDQGDTRLKKDIENGLYIENKNGNLINIQDNRGNALTFDSHHTWNDSLGSSGEHKRLPYAVELQDDGTYKLAVKTVDTNNGITTQRWEIHSIKENGELQWGSGRQSVADYEQYFKQDLNGDNAIGYTYDKIPLVHTDTQGIRLRKDVDNSLFIDRTGDGDGEEILIIKDRWGNIANLDYKSSWTDYYSGETYQQEKTTIAVEEAGDGSYKLAVQFKETISSDSHQSPEINTEWEFYSVNHAGELDWRSRESGGVVQWEEFFGEDLNDDGATGINYSAFTLVTSDGVGDLLLKDSDDSLYIDIEGKGVEYLAIVDEWGNAPSFDHSSSWSDASGYTNSSQSNAYAVEALQDGSYQLAIKHTDVENNIEIKSRWMVYSIDSNGVLDWSSGKSGSISKWEKYFNDDLNGDGQTGIDLSMPYVSTDKHGARLKRDSDDALYIEINLEGQESEKELIAIVDQWGNSPQIENDSSWSNGAGTTGFNKSEAIAVEHTDDGYQLAIKHTSSFNENQTVQWAIYSIDSNGVLDYSHDWINSITSWEVAFQEDLNSDGEIGLNINALDDVTTDEGIQRLKKGADQSLYIVNGDSSNSILPIKDSAGNSVAFDHFSSWSDGVNDSGSNQTKAYAVEQLENNTYNLAIQYKDTFKDTTTIQWAVYNVAEDGTIDWGSNRWGKIGRWEESFNQDLNGDEVIGIDFNMPSVATDTQGVRLKQDGDKTLYIDVNQNDNPSTKELIAISDQWDNPISFDQSSSWFDPAGNQHSNTTSAYAVEKDDDGTYKLAVKYENSYKNEVINSEWAFYTINADGILDWNKTQWGKITQWESFFDEDFNNDGVRGVQINDVASDTSGIRLQRDSDNSLYIKPTTEADEPTLIIDQWGHSITFDSTSSWTDALGQTHTHQVESIAIEQDQDDLKNYQLAVKTTDTYNGSSSVIWNVYSINSDGVLDWNNVANGNIGKFEPFFKQDLNGDDKQGISYISLDTDQVGDKLFTDSDHYIYIDPNGDGNEANFIPAVDEWGNSLSFYNNESWSKGNESHESEAFAVEKVGDSFKLAVKYIDRFDSNETTNWAVYTLDQNGVIDWSSVYWGSVAKWEEEYFKDDLNDDGATGLNLELEQINSDTTGAKLTIDQENSLWIDSNDDGTSDIAIIDAWGNTPKFDYSSSWKDASGFESSHSSESVAVEQQDDGSYKLAIKNTESYTTLIDGTKNTKETTNWNIYSVSPEGILDWGSSNWGSIGGFEELFNQDLNGDQEIGFNMNALEDVKNTDGNKTDIDSGGAKLKKDSENSLYIDRQGNAQNIIPIVDTNNNAITFDYSSSWSDGRGNTNSHSAQSYAVQEYGEGYVLAIKYEDQHNSNQIQTKWSVYEVSQEGVIDWASASWDNIKEWEMIFDQDMNGDGRKGHNQADKPILVQTDTHGARLKRDSDNHLYISLGSKDIAITDEFGETPIFEFDQSWIDYNGNDRSYTSESIAVEQQNDGSYKLAVKNTELFNDDSSSSWNIYDINDEGVLDWGASAQGSIQKWEQTFAQDLSEDGIVGISTAKLKKVQTDAIGTLLYKDPDDHSLYIDLGDDSQFIPITDAWGGSPTFELNESWSDENQNIRSESSHAVAVEQLDNGTFKLAVQYNEFNNDDLLSNWTVYSINAEGQLDWGSASNGSIAKWEPDFNQDLNLDNTIGLSSNREAVHTDTTGARLFKDSENSLYIDIDGSGEILIPITDENDGSPRFDYSSSTDTGSYQSDAIAVEEQADGTFKLLTRNTDQHKADIDISWNIYAINQEGVLDWESLEWHNTASSLEYLFNQDFASSSTDAISQDLLSVNMLEKSDANVSSDNLKVNVKVERQVSEIDLKQAQIDSNHAFRDTEMEILSDLIDFTITIENEVDHGGIESIAFALPDDYEDFIYYKLDEVTGKYYDFSFDPVTGEGAIIQNEDDQKFMRVFIRDNGEHDSDNRPGFIRDPFLLSGSQASTALVRDDSILLFGEGSNAIYLTDVKSQKILKSELPDNLQVIKSIQQTSDSIHNYQVLMHSPEKSTYHVWSTNDKGVKQRESAGYTIDQAVRLGWEDLFDYNLDDISDQKFSRQGIELGFDGFKPQYLLQQSNTTRQLKLSHVGSVLSDSSSIRWDAIAAISNDQGSQVLMKGMHGSIQNYYNIFSTDHEGVVQSRTGWKDHNYALEAGWNDLFNQVLGENPQQNQDLHAGINIQIKDSKPIYLLNKQSTDESVEDIELKFNSDSLSLSAFSFKRWDAKAAIEEGDGFYVLIEGSQGIFKNHFNILRTDLTGEVISKADWKSTGSAVESGWEDLFKYDLNHDGITGFELNPGISIGFDKLNSKYLLIDELTKSATDMKFKSSGDPLSNSSFTHWDAVAATKTAQGFDVLIEGKEGNVNGQFNVFSTDQLGVVTDKTGWKTQESAFDSGWEAKFNYDLNNDSHIASDQRACICWIGLLVRLTPQI